MKWIADLVSYDDFAKRGRLVATCLACVLLAASLACAAPGWGIAIFPSGTEFSLEIAADSLTRSRGYMFREHVAANEGMLFIFDEPDIYPFWMKNCKVTLDIIWLDPNFRVVEIAHDSQPCVEGEACSDIMPMRSASYVLEVAGGTSKREGLVLGDRISVMLESSSP